MVDLSVLASFTQVNEAEMSFRTHTMCQQGAEWLCVSHPLSLFLLI